MGSGYNWDDEKAVSIAIKRHLLLRKGGSLPVGING